MAGDQAESSGSDRDRMSEDDDDDNDADAGGGEQAANAAEDDAEEELADPNEPTDVETRALYARWRYWSRARRGLKDAIYGIYEYDGAEPPATIDKDAKIKFLLIFADVGKYAPKDGRDI
jgi:hypothetical protein